MTTSTPLSVHSDAPGASINPSDVGSWAHVPPEFQTWGVLIAREISPTRWVFVRPRPMNAEGVVWYDVAFWNDGTTIGLRLSREAIVALSEIATAMLFWEFRLAS
jgi:hypothetical protein